MIDGLSDENGKKKKLLRKNMFKKISSECVVQVKENILHYLNVPFFLSAENMQQNIHFHSVSLFL